MAFMFFALPIHTFADESVKSVAPKITEFKDILSTHDSFVAIDYLRESGIVGGYSDGTFGPDKSINRAEVLKIILKGSKIDPLKEFKEAIFPDIKKDDWFTPYAMKAKQSGIVKGDEKTGKFVPARQINKAEFLKMLLTANKIQIPEVKKDQVVALDVSFDKWFASYMDYAFKTGIISKDSKGNLSPSKLLTRSEVADMMYLLILIKNSKDTQFLLHRAEAELSQIEIYIAANKVNSAKHASEIAVDLTQQAYKNMPKDAIVLGAAKLAKSYDLLVDSFVYGIKKDFEKASEYANQSISKATEAWKANSATQPVAHHIKERAREILAQVGGVEKK